MKLSALIRRLIASTMLLGAVPAYSYNLSEQISASGYENGKAFELSFIIGGISSDYDGKTWNITTLIPDTYYLIAQAYGYIGLSSQGDSMLNGEADDPEQWATSTQDDGRVHQFTSNGYLYSWLSLDSNGFATAMKSMPGTTVTISSNGKNTTTVSFVCPDPDNRSSVVTLNNVVLNASDIVINDNIAFAGIFSYNNKEYVAGAQWVTIDAGESYRSSSQSHYAVVENSGTLEMQGSVWSAQIYNSTDAVVKVLSESGSDAISIEGHEGVFSWNASVVQEDESTKITAGVGAVLKGNVTVHDGAVLCNAYCADDDETGLGVNYYHAPERVFTVEKGGTLDLNGGETYYHVMLQEGAVLANTGADISYAWKGLPVVDLEGDATVHALYDFGMVGQSYGNVALNLNGHTITKTGESAFYLCNTTANAGAIDVQEGTLALIFSAQNYSKNANDLSDSDIRIASGAVLDVKGVNPDSVTDSNVLTHKVQSISGPGTIRLQQWAKLEVESAQITFLSESDSIAEMCGVNVNSSGIQGNVPGASMENVWMQHPLDEFSIADVQMQNVHFSADLATLMLTNVSFDENCTFTVGADGRIVLSDAVVNVGLSELGEVGIYTVDLSELFQCSVEGELTLSLDTAALLDAGYTGVQVDFGASSTENYTGLSLSLNGASYDGMVDNVAGFTFTVPEPATGALSLLALAALVARRRRA